MQEGNASAGGHSDNKDGAMRYANPGDPVYAPNSFGGPVADPQPWRGEEYHVSGEIMRTAYWRSVHPELGAQVGKGLDSG